MSYTVWTNALHDASIISPVLGPLPHVVVRGVVDTAVAPCTLSLRVDMKNTIRAHELVVFHVADSDLSKDALMP